MIPNNEDAVWLLEQYGEKYMSMGTPSLLDAAKEAEKILVCRWLNTPGPEQRALFHLQRAIAAEEEADVRPRKSKRRVLTVTESAYDTILETLALDSQATNFDRKLRAQIRRALNSIREVAPKVRIDVRGGCADVSAAPSYVEVRIVDHDNHDTR